MNCLWLNSERLEQVCISEFDNTVTKAILVWGDSKKQVSVDLGHLSGCFFCGPHGVLLPTEKLYDENLSSAGHPWRWTAWSSVAFLDRLTLTAHRCLVPTIRLLVLGRLLLQPFHVLLPPLGMIFPQIFSDLHTLTSPPSHQSSELLCLAITPFKSKFSTPPLTSCLIVPPKHCGGLIFHCLYPSPMSVSLVRIKGQW